MAVVELNIQAKREKPIPPSPPPGGIVLEKGKTYRNGYGTPIGPMIAWHSPTHEGRPVLFAENTGSVYFADDGRYIGLHAKPHQAHIVEEVWKYEDLEKEWHAGAKLEYNDPENILTSPDVWKPWPSVTLLTKYYGKERALRYMRGTYGTLNYRRTE